MPLTSLCVFSLCVLPFLSSSASAHDFERSIAEGPDRQELWAYLTQAVHKEDQQIQDSFSAFKTRIQQRNVNRVWGAFTQAVDVWKMRKSWLTVHNKKRCTLFKYFLESFLHQLDAEHLEQHVNN